MEGQVFVPYTGIGGFNMDSGIMPLDISGSTEEPAPTGAISTTVGVRWTYPGGIMNGGTHQLGFWGYALYRRSDNQTFTYDSDVLEWLLGGHRPGVAPRYELKEVFTQDQINSGDTIVIEEMNNMVRKYVSELLFGGETGGDMTEFRDVFQNCIYPA